MLLFLTGCLFGDVGRGYLQTECVKEETNLNDLTIKTTYVIGHKESVVNDVSVTYEHSGNDTATILAIKNSIQSQNRYLNNDDLKIEILIDEVNNFKVIYNMEVDKIPEEIFEKFNLNRNRSDLVKSLTDEGFTCR